MTYYRYDVATTGHVDRVLEPEGARRFDYAGDSTFDEDYFTADDVNDLLTYWALALDYDG